MPQETSSTAPAGLSLCKALAASSLTVPFSVQTNLQSHDGSLRSIIEGLQLPPVDLNAWKCQNLFTFEAKDPQGIAYDGRKNWYLTAEHEIFRYSKIGSFPMGLSLPEIERKATLKDVLPQIDVKQVKKIINVPNSPVGSQTMEYWHCGNPAWKDGLLFVPVACRSAAFYPIVLALTEDLKTVGYAVPREGSDAWCAVNPMDGFLYLGHPVKNCANIVYRYDVAAFFDLYKSGKGWGRCVEMPKLDKPFLFCEQDGTPSYPLGIQGISFSPEGRVFVAKWKNDEDYIITDFGAKVFINRMLAYNAFTGRRLSKTKEYDFDGTGDEIEGCAAHPDGSLYVAMAVNDLATTDDFHVLKFTPPH